MGAPLINLLRWSSPSITWDDKISHLTFSDKTVFGVIIAAIGESTSVVVTLACVVVISSMLY